MILFFIIIHYKIRSLVVGANNSQFNTNNKGSYNVQETDENGCITNSDTVFVETKSISNIVSSAELKLYPNPTQIIVTIDAPIKVNVKVLNMVGSLIMTIENAKEINLANQVDGSYFFYILDEQNQLISVEKIQKLNR